MPEQYPSELMPENRDAWDLWLEISTQFEMSMMGRTGLKYEAMYREADRMGISIDNGMKRKIRSLEVYELNRKPAKDDD